MNNNKITCPNCHLSIDKTLEKCPYCGETVAKKEKVEVDEDVNEVYSGEKKKIKLNSHTKFYLYAAILEALMFFCMFLPGESNLFRPIFFWAFVSTSTEINGARYIIGTNAATICFIFIIVSILNSVFIFLSIKRKTTEISLFSYFVIFTLAVVGVVSLLSSALMSHNSGGDRASQFKIGLGFIVIGNYAFAAIALNLVGVIKYKKFLVNSPLETFKSKK